MLANRLQMVSVLTTRDLLEMCVDVARGMKYLSEMDPPIIHRDLALRNLLLGSSVINNTQKRVVKVQAPLDEIVMAAYVTYLVTGC